MTTTTMFRVSGLAACLLAAPLFAQPSHNTCGGAIPIAPCGGVYSGSTIGATQDGSSSCSFNDTRDVWHTVTIPTWGTLTVYICPASFDTVLSVHFDCPGTTANQMACNDDSGYCGTAYPRTSALSMPIGRGTYYIRVAGFAGATGDYTLNTNFSVGYDACSDAFPIGTNISTTGSTSCATADGSASCSITNSTPDVWYRYIPRCSGNLTLYTCPVSFDTVLSVHSGCPGTAANQIACNDNLLYCGTAYPNASALFLPVTAGQPYLIRVSGFNGATGDFELHTLLDPSGTPPNDACANAIPVANGPTPFGTCGATTDGPVEPLCPNDPQLSSDVWYRYTAATGGSATVSLCDSNYDTMVGIYRAGCPGAGGQLIACDDDACPGYRSSVSFPIARGQHYLIRIGGYNGAQGTGTMNISSCYPNCDGSTASPKLTANDFQCFINAFAAGDPYANCDGSTGNPPLTANDFQCFINKYAAGCP